MAVEGGCRQPGAAGGLRGHGMGPRPALGPGPAAPTEAWVPMPGTARESPPLPPAPARAPWPLRCLGAGATCCSLALLLGAVLSPRWLLIDSPADGYHSGLWWLCTRPVCASVLTKTPSFKALRALMLLALLSSCVAVASLIIPVRPFARWRVSRFLVSAVANFIAGLLVLVGVVVFTAHMMLDAVNPQARASFEWAFFLAWTLSPLFILSGILCLFVHSCLPAMSRRVGPQGQPGQDLEETLAQGGLERGSGAKTLPQEQETLAQGELEEGLGAERLPQEQETPQQEGLEGGLRVEPLPRGQETPTHGELESEPLLQGQETPAQGGLEGGPGAERLPQRQEMLAQGGLEQGPGSQPLPQGQETPAQGELEGGLRVEPLPWGQGTPGTPAHGGLESEPLLQGQEMSSHEGLEGGPEAEPLPQGQEGAA